MFSLIQFDNGEDSVLSSKRVKIIQGEDCIVKWSGGASYHAHLIKASDDKKMLLEFKERRANNSELQITTDSNSNKNIHNLNIRKNNDSHKQQCKDLKINIVALDDMKLFSEIERQKHSSESSFTIKNDQNNERKIFLDDHDKKDNKDNDVSTASESGSSREQIFQNKQYDENKFSEDIKISLNDSNTIYDQYKLLSTSSVNVDYSGKTINNSSENLPRNDDSVNIMNVEGPSVSNSRVYEEQHLEDKLCHMGHINETTKILVDKNDTLDDQPTSTLTSLVNRDCYGTATYDSSKKLSETNDRIYSTDVEGPSVSNSRVYEEQHLEDKLCHMGHINETTKILVDKNDTLDDQPTSTLTSLIDRDCFEKTSINSSEKLSENNDWKMYAEEPSASITQICQEQDLKNVPYDLSLGKVCKFSTPRKNEESMVTKNDLLSSDNKYMSKCHIVEDRIILPSEIINFSTPKMVNRTLSSELHLSSSLLNNISCILGDQTTLSCSIPSGILDVFNNSILNLTDSNKKISLLNSPYHQDNMDGKNNDSTSSLQESIHSDNNTSDPNYVPSESSQNNSHEKSLEKSSASEESFFDNTPSLDIQKLTVLSTDDVDSDDSQKDKSKKHFCLYCKTLQSQIARHLILKHSDETDVKNFMCLTKNSLERKKAIAKIRKDGYYLHNTSQEYNTGILIIPRKCNTKSANTAEDYIPCKKCKLYLSKSSIRFHVPYCDKSREKGTRTVLQDGRRLAGYIHPCASETLRRTIFPVFKDDFVVRCIKYDELIIKFGNKLCEKYTLTHQHDHIRAQLRLLGRLKMEMMQLDKTINVLMDILEPKQFDNVIKSIKIVATWDNNIMWYKHPSVAQNLTTLVKKCAKTFRVECIKSEDNNRKTLVENFLLLWEEEVPTTINKKALEDQIAQKRLKRVILPSKSDIKLLYDYLQEQCCICLEILTNEFIKSAWILLIQSTLILVQIFNRRRAGEIERLMLTDYQNKESLNENLDPDIYKNLSENTKQYAAQFKRLTIRGKRGRIVPVLLSPRVVNCIDIILKYRQEAKIPASNEFIFSKPCKSKLSKQYFRACPLMRRFANECGALIPSALRGTTLRKHIATYTAMLNVEDAQIERLANFMGHSKDIHKNVYRIPVPVAEITDVSRLLIAAIGDDDEEDNEGSDEENSDSSDDDENDGDNDPIPDNHNKDVKRKTSHSLVSEYGETFKRQKIEVTHPALRNGKTRQKWSESEKEAVTKFFGNLLMLPKLPSLKECQNCISMNRKILLNRTAEQLKTWIDNQRRAADRKTSYSRAKNAKN